MEALIAYFAIFGGHDSYEDLGFFEDLFSTVEKHFVKQFHRYEAQIRPSYLLETPYRDLLIVLARGEGKQYRSFRKAKLSDRVGEALVEDLVDKGILRIEYSREAPLKHYPKQKIKRELRTYTIEHKLRFVHPFVHFWFAFVAPYHNDLAQGKSERFLRYFTQHHARLRARVFEELSHALLVQRYAHKQILSSGSYWNVHSEFDLLMILKGEGVVLGECKYKDRVVCKSELKKLQYKANASGINATSYALFSKSGFSKELLDLAPSTLELFELADFRRLL
jgi:hypothetical protein